jgi:recombination protein RecR
LGAPRAAWGARSLGRSAISNIAGPVAALINEFSKLPTIGPKTAARLVFHLLNKPRADAESLAEAIVALKDRVRLCSRCFSLTEEDPCAICNDTRRDAKLLCVVAEAKDIYSLERTSAYNGRYHVLGGLISPMDGIGPAQLRVKDLIERIGASEFDEVTALYLSRLITPIGVRVTRLAYGLPIGGDLDYADEVTLAKALEGRRTLV